MVVIINYMIADGLRQAGRHNMVDRIIEDSLHQKERVQLIEKSGFAEYFDPIDIFRTACGGNSFSWTAAIVLEFMQNKRKLKIRLALYFNISI